MRKHRHEWSGWVGGWDGGEWYRVCVVHPCYMTQSGHVVPAGRPEASKLTLDNRKRALRIGPLKRD